MSHIARYFSREVSSSPKSCDTPSPPWLLSFTQAHLSNTPFRNISHDDCAIPHNRHEKRAQTQTLGPDIFRWGRGLPHEGVGAKKLGMSLKTRETKLFGRDIPGFCWDIPAAPEKFEKKRFVFNSRPLHKTSTKEFCDTITTSIVRYEKYRCWVSKLAISSAIRQIASECSCDAVAHSVSERLHQPCRVAIGEEFSEEVLASQERVSGFPEKGLTSGEVRKISGEVRGTSGEGSLGNFRGKSGCC